MEFYVYLNGAKRGPLTEDRVQALLSEGLLRPSDLAAEQPDGTLKPLGDFRRFTAPLNSSAPPPESASAGAAAAPAGQEMQVAAPPPPPLPAASAEFRPLQADELGPYSRSSLAPDELPFYRTSLHWIIFARFAGAALLAFLFIAMPFAIGLQALLGTELGWFALPLPALIMLTPTLAYASSELVITDRRVLIKTGIVRRQTLELFIARVESIGVDQGFFGRMFDYGTVLIRGTGGSEEAFEAIAHPLEFRNTVRRLQTSGASR